MPPDVKAQQGQRGEQERRDEAFSRLVEAFADAVTDWVAGRTDDDPYAALDAMVLASKAGEADAIQHRGFDSQIRYLLERGRSEGAILKALNGGAVEP